MLSLLLHLLFEALFLLQFCLIDGLLLLQEVVLLLLLVVHELVLDWLKRLLCQPLALLEHLQILSFVHEMFSI